MKKILINFFNKFIKLLNKSFYNYKKINLKK